MKRGDFRKEILLFYSVEEPLWLTVYLYRIVLFIVSPRACITDLGNMHQLYCSGVRNEFQIFNYFNYFKQRWLELDIWGKTCK